MPTDRTAARALFEAATPPLPSSGAEVRVYRYAVMRFAWVLGLLVVAMPAHRVHAQGNDQFAPTGGRSTLMGNTGVALARDGSAPFYNPATIVRISDERLAFSVNFYSLELMHFSNFHEPGPVDRAVFGGSASNSGMLVSTFRVLP